MDGLPRHLEHGCGTCRRKRVRRPFSSATVEFKDGKAHIRTCFTAGTLIHTKEGLKVIEEIQIGDVVLSWNEDTGEKDYKEVTELFLHEVELLYEVRIQRPHDGSLTSLVDETILETTWNHPFWVVDKKEWVEVRDLKVGDRVLLSDGKEVAISGIKSYNVDTTKVYNFEVADNHTYFVGEDGVLVHNYKNEDSPSWKILNFITAGSWSETEKPDNEAGPGAVFADRLLKKEADLTSVGDAKSLVTGTNFSDEEVGVFSAGAGLLLGSFSKLGKLLDRTSDLYKVLNKSEVAKLSNIASELKTELKVS